MEQRNTDIGLVWHSFSYEVNRATASLMYLLQGMESVRKSELPPSEGMPADYRQFATCFPKLPSLDVQLSLSGTGFDLNDVLKSEGEAEQLAFKGWVEQVYFLWESRYRNELKDSLEGSGIIRPEGDAIGDFRLIRNDLIHNHGVASEEHSGKCTTLKWFEPCDRIVLGMRHVFDFLNQMGLMTTMTGFLNDGPVAAWTIFPDVETVLRSRPVPPIVSLRTSMVEEQEDGSSWHALHIVFDNGVFANIPLDYRNDGSSLPERIEFVRKTHIDLDGNLCFANGIVKDRMSVYSEAVDALVGKGPRIGLPVPGPAYRIRK